LRLLLLLPGVTLLLLLPSALPLPRLLLLSGVLPLQYLQCSGA
jgi:hypothetical protein